MAKKKKRRRSGRRGTKKRSSGPKAKPMGLAAGGTLSAAAMATDKQNIYGASAITFAKDMKVNEVIVCLKDAASDFKNYKPALAGLLITASPKIPVVSILARPVDRGLKRLTRGKWGL